ncbi:protein FAN-like [Schistocerca gregaria]|uniref:protein FAN-like n=1 Tax=Schistocerca gregaria TaxID=7010 RepID=UPI00211F0AA9|nr:protein FAN-like [Schistocerca gregaria]XP_049848405.1 protein FAN-like [Schistocerca gregaria]
MYINSAACRSFNDLAQYPVFPWVISDYESPTLDFNDVSIYRDLSKPVGALNPERLELFRLRYQETPKDQDAFLYGTHYSTPAYVLYYLLRCLPEHMLKLQNGKFDEPDRLFNSISETWNNVLANPTDLKELIPEFFCVETEGRFLVNEKDINFGIRQNRQQVADVALPAWAKTPIDFICMNKLALESEYVSAHLHEWIDLIFGYKQTGPEAVKANNLFHSLTYVDQIDIEGEEDPARKEIILMQINEFGQVPVRLFDKPHPQRFSSKEHLQVNSSHCTEIAKTPQLFSKITGPSPLDAAASKDLPPEPFNYEDVRHSKSKLDYGIITLQEFEQLIKQECISDASLHSLRPANVPVIEESLLMRTYSPHNESAVRSPPSHQSTAKDCSRMTTFNCN